MASPAAQRAHAYAVKAQIDGTPLWVLMADAFGPTQAGKMMLAYCEAVLEFQERTSTDGANG